MEIISTRPDDHATIVAIWHESAKQMDGGLTNLDSPS
jgi:hypothetical protein